MSNVMKIRLLGAELLHADKRTDKQTEYRQWDDVTKLIVAFRNFMNKSNNITLVLFVIIFNISLN